MVIGKASVRLQSNNAEHLFQGAALGDLGRHTMKDADGMPEFTHRTQVFEQVRPRRLWSSRSEDIDRTDRQVLRRC